MPAFSGSNILFLSDGTGQAGGLQIDEFRSDVYKLYRATRCGPDTTIDPHREFAFYESNLGSKLAGDDTLWGQKWPPAGSLIRPVCLTIGSPTPRCKYLS